MRRPLKMLTLALGLFMGALCPAWAQAPQPTPLTREQVEQIVRDYLLRNPEVILEAVQSLEDKRRAQAETAQRAAVSAKRDAILKDPDAPVAGNPNGDVTLVEFFDYRCPYCKRVAEPLAELLKADRNLRFVYKELPILGPESVVASRAALAARAQGKYQPMHDALMRARGTLDEQAVFRIAGEVGLDVGRLKADMARPEITAMLDRNLKLAKDLGLNGTPAFVIGDRVIPGAVDLDTLKQLVADARAR